MAGEPGGIAAEAGGTAASGGLEASGGALASGGTAVGGAATSGGATATGGAQASGGRHGQPVGGMDAPGSGGMAAGGPQTTGGAGATGGVHTPAPQACEAGATSVPGRTVERIEHDGVRREFILYVPASYTGTQPAPLMVNFHPLLSNASAAENSSGYKALADRQGFIVAFPDSQQSAAWNVGPCCTQSRDVDDVGFVRALVAHVQSKFCIDSKMVYASGFSMGGGMSHYLGCEAADLFAAVAPGAFDLLEENTCAPARPITVISFRSTTDTIVPYDGGRKTSAPNGFRGTHTFLGAEGTFERWAQVNGCTGQPVDESGGCKTYKRCSADVEVTLCTVPGGHTWPDAERSWETISRFMLP